MLQYVVASWDHFLTAVFLGLLPVVVTTLLVTALVTAVTRSFDHILYTLTFSVLGASLGLMLGASREPVVQAFLPAIITVISGMLVIAFPKSVAAEQLAAAVEGEDKSTTIRKLVFIGMAAMLLSSVTGSFWGGSARSLREQDDRRYAEWLEMYKTVRLPIELESARRGLGLLTPPPVEPVPSTP